MILYHVFNIQQMVENKAAQVVISDNADLLDSMGIGTLTTVIGF